jgi:Glycosyltransferases involved in cell wall biogenesis
MCDIDTISPFNCEKTKFILNGFDLFVMITYLYNLAKVEKNMKTISIIVPCFNEQESINIYYDAMTKIKEQTNKFNLEYWFIDDGSKIRLTLF